VAIGGVGGVMARSKRRRHTEAPLLRLCTATSGRRSLTSELLEPNSDTMKVRSFFDDCAAGRLGESKTNFGERHGKA